MPNRRAMSWPLVALLIWPCCLVLSRPWAEPRETGTATATADWSPAPTRHISVDDGVLRRSIFPVSVCGWIGAKPASPVYCSASSSCVWNSDDSIVGCCTTAGSDCAFYTSCIDQGSPTQVGDRSDVFTCRGTSVCYLNTYPNNYHQWGCGAAAWATTIATTFPGMNADQSLQIVFTGRKAAGSISGSAPSTSTPSQSSSTFSSTASSVSPSGSQSSAAAGAQSSPAATSQSFSSSSSSSAAAIGGGVGGGVGGLLLIGLAVAILYWWRKKHKKHEIAQTDDINDPGHKPPVEETVPEHGQPVELPAEQQYELP